jgi:hypothetical protein
MPLYVIFNNNTHLRIARQGNRIKIELYPAILISPVTPEANA